MFTLISWRNSLSEMLTSLQKTKENMNYFAFVEHITNSPKKIKKNATVIGFRCLEKKNCVFHFAGLRVVWT